MQKDIFLQEFKREKEIAKELFSDECVIIADEIVNVIKTKELTYEEAYAALELSYKKLKYESNFVKVV